MHVTAHVMAVRSGAMRGQTVTSSLSQYLIPRLYPRLYEFIMEEIQSPLNFAPCYVERNSLVGEIFFAGRNTVQVRKHLLLFPKGGGGGRGVFFSTVFACISYGGL